MRMIDSSTRAMLGYILDTQNSVRVERHSCSGERGEADITVENSCAASLNAINVRSLERRRYVILQILVF
jgi:hypothetical protein